MSASTLPTLLVSDPLFRDHDTGEGHPESAARLDAVLSGIWRQADWQALAHQSGRSATDSELRRCHSQSYVQSVQRDVEGGYDLLSTGDTFICRESDTVARHAAGAVLDAVDAVCEGRAKNAFCAVRPPGHHASADVGMGFCIYNHVALAARRAQDKHGIQHVLIVDWDVHHGNGTQDIFYSDSTVFFFSTHQAPLYPGTGAAYETGHGEGEGFTLNCPFPAGAGRDEVLGAMESKLLPAVEQFKPGLILVSAGFDSREGDPLGGFRLTDTDFADMTTLLLDLAHRHAGGRLVSLLEGGYALEGLASAAGHHVAALQSA